MTAADSTRASSSTTTMAPMGLLRRGKVVPDDPHTADKSVTQQGQDGGAHLLRERADRPTLGPTAGVVDVDVHEPSLGRRLCPGALGIALEEPDAVDHRGGAHLVDDHAEVDRLGV